MKETLSGSVERYTTVLQQRQKSKSLGKDVCVQWVALSAFHQKALDLLKVLLLLTQRLQQNTHERPLQSSSFDLVLQFILHVAEAKWCMCKYHWKSRWKASVNILNFWQKQTHELQVTLEQQDSFQNMIHFEVRVLPKPNLIIFQVYLSLHTKNISKCIYLAN